jgi:DNA anti-recombination protein RmuC
MSKTIQRRSWVTLDEQGKDLTIKKIEYEENANLISSLADDLKDLKKELDMMLKVGNSLSDAGTNYLQATQKATQSLASLIQEEGKRK